MMKSVLISIQPKWCELIASGKKTVEVRKTRPKLETPFKVYIYCTQGDKSKALLGGNPMRIVTCTDYRVAIPVGCYIGNGKVIGEFVCDKVVEFENSMYEPAFHETSVLSCVEYEKLALYLGKKDFGYDWHISNLVIYDKPRELSEFHKPIMPTELRYENDIITRPPQSWCYVESEGGK